MSIDDRAVDYEIGFRKPPRRHQFQPGRSGNPKGRPKNPIGFDQQVIREFETLVTVQENGRSIRLSKRELLIKQALHQAIKGNSRILRFAVSLLQQALERKDQREAKIQSTETFDSNKLNTTQLMAYYCCELSTGLLEAAVGMSDREASDYIYGLIEKTCLSGAAKRNNTMGIAP